MKIQTLSQLPSGFGSRGFRASLAAFAITGFLGINSSVMAQLRIPLDLGSRPPVVVLNPDEILRVVNPVYAAKFTCGIWDEGKTAAQFNSGLGAASPLPRRSTLRDYHDFQPGSYSTALNIFNPNRQNITVQVVVSSESLSSPQTIATLNIASLNAAKVGCTDIEPFLPTGFSNGELVEGFLYIVRGTTDILVKAVYSYSTIAAFQEFRGQDSAAGGAGGGAGGLGLGGSIDIETIEPWTRGK
ncbi:MAG: hypothetical protein V3V31_15995 [Methylococcales bacterium]